MLTQIDETVGACQRRSGRGNEHLAAMRGSRDPRRPVHLQPHIPRLVHRHLTRVHPHPHTKRRRLQRDLRRRRSRERIRRTRERDEERVPRRVDLGSAMRDPRGSTGTVMLGQQLRVAVVPDLLEQQRRPLDVREHERDGATWQIAAHGVW